MTNDELGGNQRDAGFRCVGADLLQDIVNALIAHSGEVLVDRSKRGWIGGGFRDVVEADQADVFGDGLSFFPEGPEQAEGHVVVGGKYSGAPGFIGEP